MVTFCLEVILPQMELQCIKKGLISGGILWSTTVEQKEESVSPTYSYKLCQFAKHAFNVVIKC